MQHLATRTGDAFEWRRGNGPGYRVIYVGEGLVPSRSDNANIGVGHAGGHKTLPYDWL